MKIQKKLPFIDVIKINIKDSKYFADVAFLVDRDDFMIELAKLRKKWNLDKKLLDNNNRSKLFPLEIEISKQPANSAHAVDLEKKLNDFDYVDKLDINKRVKLLNAFKKALRQEDAGWDFDFDIKDLRMRFKRPPYFDKIIESALLYGAIDDRDYVPYELKILYPNADFLPFFEEEEIVLSFSPLAKRVDIKNYLSKELDRILKIYEENVLGGFLFNVGRKTDAIPTHRRWYWLNTIEGLSPEKIYNNNQLNTLGIEEDGITKAIRRYRELLSIKI